MENGSTLIEKNIGALGGEDIFILHENHRPTSLHLSPAISRQVSLSLLGALGLTIPETLLATADEVIQ